MLVVTGLYVDLDPSLLVSKLQKTKKMMKSVENLRGGRNGEGEEKGKKPENGEKGDKENMVLSLLQFFSTISCLDNFLCDKIFWTNNMA